MIKLSVNYFLKMPNIIEGINNSNIFVQGKNRMQLTNELPT